MFTFIEYCKKNYIPQKGYTCYNLVFPIWVLFFYPTITVLTIPFNILIDFLVIFLTSKILTLSIPKFFFRKTLWKTVLCGYIFDSIGGLILFVLSLIPDLHLFSEVVSETAKPLSDPIGFSIVSLIVFLSGCAIYFINRSIFKLHLDESSATKLALSLAIFTAPYLFFFPYPFF